ncbi:hypothetical protein [Rhodococcus sp. 05-2255-3B1]|uniref:hypothetical protein n=1 Tax=Rhodococcus sp. 05-2255-3B1 TaxID=2022482 RepID=UPI00117B30BF|nr:hypothetical protein [Rhodococcus sp. 05-2255-3B1]
MAFDRGGRAIADDLLDDRVVAVLFGDGDALADVAASLRIGHRDRHSAALGRTVVRYAGDPLEHLHERLLLVVADRLRLQALADVLGLRLHELDTEIADTHPRALHDR